MDDPRFEAMTQKDMEDTNRSMKHILFQHGAIPEGSGILRGMIEIYNMFEPFNLRCLRTCSMPTFQVFLVILQNDRKSEKLGSRKYFHNLQNPANTFLSFIRAPMI